MKYKPYGNLQLLPILTYCWKNLSMDFVTRLSISADWKRKSYNSVLVIIDWLIKTMHYEPVKVTIDTPGLAKVILDVVIW